MPHKPSVHGTQGVQVLVQVGNLRIGQIPESPTRDTPHQPQRSPVERHAFAQQAGERLRRIARHDSQVRGGAVWGPMQVNPVALGADGPREIPAVGSGLLRCLEWRPPRVRGYQLGLGSVFPQNESKATEPAGIQLSPQPSFAWRMANKGQDGPEIALAQPAEGMGRHAEDTAPVGPNAIANDPRELRIAPSRRSVGEVWGDQASYPRLIEEDLPLEPLAVAPAEAPPHPRQSLTLNQGG